MEKTIDPKIQPLVAALNSVSGLNTIASCEGHFSRISCPYVYFRCPPHVAENISIRLGLLFNQDTLEHWWHLVGYFHPDYGLCFILKAPALDHDCGFFKKLLNYVVFRKKIDSDLTVLSNELNQTLNDMLDGGREGACLIGAIKHKGGQNSDDQANQAVAPLSFGDAPERVRFTASRTRPLNAGRNATPTMVASCRITHALVHSFPNIPWNLARRFGAVAILGGALAACANNREIQYDGTGTDEMRKSPCVCLPVKYQAPKFKWGTV